MQGLASLASSRFGSAEVNEFIRPRIGPECALELAAYLESESIDIDIEKNLYVYIARARALEIAKSAAGAAIEIVSELAIECHFNCARRRRD